MMLPAVVFVYLCGIIVAVWVLVVVFAAFFSDFFVRFFYRDRKGQVSASLTSVNDFLRHL